MKVKELINRLKEFDENAEIELQYYDAVSLCQQTAPASECRDLYENEEVPETEAREFATSVNAIYALTSAQNNNGIDKLFEEIGESYMKMKI